MRKGLFMLLGIFAVNAMVAGVVLADKKEDVMALLNKGQAYIQKNGMEKAKEAFTTEEFKNGDLYIFAYDYNGVCVAHGVVPKKIGKNFYNLKSPEGKYHVQTLIDIAKKGGGWYEYRWINPKTKKMQDKVSYIMPIKGQDSFIASGY